MVERGQIERRHRFLVSGHKAPWSIPEKVWNSHAGAQHMGLQALCCNVYQIENVTALSVAEQLIVPVVLVPVLLLLSLLLTYPYVVSVLLFLFCCCSTCFVVLIVVLIVVVVVAPLLLLLLVVISSSLSTKMSWLKKAR